MHYRESESLRNYDYPPPSIAGVTIKSGRPTPSPLSPQSVTKIREAVKEAPAPPSK